jgi:hypothetical protein
MQTTLIHATTASVVMLALAACGGNQRPAEPPTQTTTTTGGTTGVSGMGGPFSPGDPMGISPSGTTTTSGAPASPMEGGCPDSPMPAGASDLRSCWDGCQGLDETVPVGSSCMSSRASCMAKCNTSYAEPGNRGTP